MQQLLGALRVNVRAVNNTRIPASKFNLNFRSFASIYRLSSSLLRTPTPIPIAYSAPAYSLLKPSILTSPQCQHRTLSLGSLGSFFDHGKPAQTPSTGVVGNVTSTEIDADAAPHDLEKQLTLFQSLMDTKVKSGYDMVIARWERMCEIVSLL
jgi:ATP-dependent metalloprotease